MGVSAGSAHLELLQHTSCAPVPMLVAHKNFYESMPEPCDGCKMAMALHMEWDNTVPRLCQLSCWRRWDPKSHTTFGKYHKKATHQGVSGHMSFSGCYPLYRYIQLLLSSPYGHNLTIAKHGSSYPDPFELKPSY